MLYNAPYFIEFVLFPHSSAEFAREKERLTSTSRTEQWRQRAELEAQRHAVFQQHMDRYRTRALSQAQQYTPR